MQPINLTNARIPQNLQPGKCMHDDSIKASIKRIERALVLIKQEKVTPVGDGQWLAQSASIVGLTYKVTLLSCTCKDREPLCKHLWAGPGRRAALLIAALISARDRLVLQFIAETVSATLEDVPEPYVKVARRIYKARLAQLADAAAAQTSLLAAS